MWCENVSKFMKNDSLTDTLVNQNLDLNEKTK